MKNILFISYRFPPQVSTRSVQVARWVKYLAKNDWEPVVVCAQENSLFKTVIDPELNKLYSSEIKVVKISSIEPEKIIKLSSKIIPFILSLPDVAIGWYRRAYKEVLPLIKDCDFKLMLSCSYPYSSHLVSLKLKRKTGIPWVAFFSDPWVDNFAVKIDPITKFINVRMEKAVMKSADAVIFISEGMKQHIMKKYPVQWLEKSYVVSQAFDPELVLKVIDNKNKDKVDASKFTITFCGLLYAYRRSPQTLFQSIQHILKYFPNIYESMKIQIVGGVSNDYKKIVKQMGIDNIVSLIERIPYMESLAYMANSDVLLSLDSPGYGSEMLHPSKIAEYMGFKKPIIYVTPDNAGWVAMLKKIGGIIISPEDTKGLAEAIMNLYQSWERGDLSKYNYTDADVEDISAVRTVEKLSMLLHKVADQNKQ